MSFKAPRGTKDIFGDDVIIWQNIEKIIREVCENFGVNELRTPMFESTTLFQRGVGETTDIVTKEMYTLEKKGKESLTLKPEGTAGAARSFVENSMYAEAQPTKLFYITPAFRYERPQAGRQRQFHQFGVEIFGSYSPACDAEAISIAYEVLKRIGIKNIVLKINSLGGSQCHQNYNEVLKKYLANNIDNLCPDCKERFEKNPLRVLDCKNENCKEILKDAPSILETLGEECKKHFEDFKKYLENMGIDYVVDEKIVRGLDYYTQTVFEFITTEIGSQGAVCAGGRYNNLVKECGGPATGAVGFAMGLERIVLLIKNQNLATGEKRPIDIYIGSIGEKGFIQAQKIGFELRSKGIKAEYDTLNRSVKAQLKYADKIKAKYTVILGDDEINTGVIKLKNMENGETIETTIDLIETHIK